MSIIYLQNIRIAYSSFTTYVYILKKFLMYGRILVIQDIIPKGIIFIGTCVKIIYA